MSKLLIWLIQIGEPLPLKENVHKMRTALLADKLTEKGHEVLWWASSFDHFKKDWIFKEDTDYQVNKSLTIKALKGRGYQRNISLSRLWDHRIIARKFKKLAVQLPKPDIIIASTPPYDLAYEVVDFANNNRIPVLVDIRDEWPDIFIEYVPPMLKKMARLLLFKDFSMIKKTMRCADGLIAMMNKLLEWGLEYAKRKKNRQDKVFYLGYKRSSNASHKSNKSLKLTEGLVQKFVVTFIGTLGHYNNPAILIDCAKRLTGSDTHFVIAGDGEFFEDLKVEAANLDNVSLPGWLDQEEIEILLQHSHVGVCPTTQNRDAFPNKTFAYLSAGLPIISAFQGEIKEIIKKHQIGFYCPPNDLDGLVKNIKELHDNHHLYKKMSENSRRVFSELFDADKIYQEYAEHVERLAKDKKQR